jgi:hypothetical protein
MPPQRLVRTGASIWSLDSVDFFIAVIGRIEQPYYKVADIAVTLQPSDVVGSITVMASAPVFVQDHVGRIIRILSRQIITGKD